MTPFAKPLLVFFSLWSNVVYGINPLVLNQGMADSHVHFWPAANEYFMYATHDYSPTNTGFRMDDWNVWSSTDLISWRLASTLYPNNTPTTNPNECWATDGATRNGNYYFYLSIGPGEVAVVNSTAPAGPWEDTLKTPLLNSSLGNSYKATFRDPCVFYDAASTNHYLIAGVFDYFIMRLGEDMMSLAEDPQPVVVRNPTGPYGAKTDDKPFLHFFNGNYYLSWGCFYGMSDSVYGPFDYKGSVINTTFIDPAFRMNRTDGPWYGWEDLADRHGSFFENTGGQWFYSSNDRSHSSDTAHPAVYRDTVLGEFFFQKERFFVFVLITPPPLTLTHLLLFTPPFNLY
jgi:arabinoxylan arabinofuranohydrolase